MTVVVFRAPSGSGKSTLANALAGDSLPEMRRMGFGPLADYVTSLWHSFEGKSAAVFSTDNAFVKNGIYEFDLKLLGEAHYGCLRAFTEAVRDPNGACHLIVDNTNCSIAEVSSYASLALAYGHKLEIISILCDPVVAWRRNRHDVPLKNVLMQHMTLQESAMDMPTWFPNKFFPATDMP